jgi:hypothetical protein
MGRVYLGRSPGGGLVAIKVIHRQFVLLSTEDFLYAMDARNGGHSCFAGTDLGDVFAPTVAPSAHEANFTAAVSATAVYAPHADAGPPTCSAGGVEPVCSRWANYFALGLTISRQAPATHRPTAQAADIARTTTSPGWAPPETAGRRKPL